MGSSRLSAVGSQLSFRAFRPDDLMALELAPAVAAHRDRHMRPGYAASLAASGLAWTGELGGRPVGCAGFIPQWPGRAVAWALLGAIPRRAWPLVVRRMRQGIAEAHGRGYRRIEAQVAFGFGDGCGFARRLGFEVEALMRAWGAEGGDYFLYARVAE